MVDPHKYCKKFVKQSNSNFYYGFLFLPSIKRKAIMDIYAFCRTVDDIVDQCNNVEIAKNNLDWWQQEIYHIFHGTPNHPISFAIKSILPYFNLKQEIFQEIIYGMEMDLDFKSYKAFDDLSLYCYRVAGTVGILVAEILGYQDLNTLEYARKLGLAFQLTNIIRDIKEDAKRGCIYIPEVELKEFTITMEDFFDFKYNKKFCALMQFQIARAKRFYREAIAILPEIDRDRQKAGLIMAKIYFTILKKTEKSLLLNHLNKKIKLNALHKLWLVWKPLNHVLQ